MDITEKKKLEIQKEELLLKLEKQNESLNDYAHMISHDLKSPLRSIHTLISWIKEEKDMLFTENGKKYMDMLVEKVEKMDNLIDGVLTISKLDTTAYKYQEVDLNEILKNDNKICSLKVFNYNNYSLILFSNKKIYICLETDIEKFLFLSYFVLEIIYYYFQLWVLYFKMTRGFLLAEII